MTAVKQIIGKDIPEDITDNKRIWRAMYKIIGSIAEPYSKIHDSPKKEAAPQAVLSRKILDNASIHAVVDPGTGTIHGNEKNQAVFFNIDELSIITKISNTLAKDLEKEKKFISGNNNIPYKKRLETAIWDKKRDPTLEQLPIPSSIRAFDLVQYIRYTGRNSWPAALGRIVKDPDASYFYASNIIGGRFKEGEPAMLTKVSDSFNYAYGVLKNRWPEAEDDIKKVPNYARAYAQEILKTRWPEAEPYIMRNKSEWLKYKDFFGIN